MFVQFVKTFLTLISKKVLDISKNFLNISSVKIDNIPFK